MKSPVPDPCWGLENDRKLTDQELIEEWFEEIDTRWFKKVSPNFLTVQRKCLPG